MKPGLVEETFASLLVRLDVDRDRAGERYEELRRILIRFFEWRGAPVPEEHTDETLDRVARKLNQGVPIENINGYCYEVARLVYLETLKGPVSRQIQLGDVNLEAAIDLSEEALEKERRLSCLDTCMEALPPEGKDLILEYYKDEKRSKIDRRKALADRLGLNREALANRAQRLRDKLERCMGRCIDRKLPI